MNLYKRATASFSPLCLSFSDRQRDEHFGRATGQTLDIIENADLVILDDLGSEFQTSFYRFRDL